MNLSIRENEVIYELVQGYQKKEIADRMCLSIHTVDTHFKNVKVKTGAKNIADLVRMYIISHKELFFSLLFVLIQSASIITKSNIIERKRKRLNKTARVTRVLKVNSKAIKLKLVA